MATTSPFHEGERRVQEQLGVREIERWARKVIRPYLPDEHRGFYASLPFLVTAARDADGRPWATLLSGAPGFAGSAEAASLDVRALPVAGDALEHALRPGDDVGFLGIELHSRRRNRVNGRVGSRSEGGFRLDVEQSFGNCPQYIHERSWQAAAPAASPRREESTRIEGAARALVEGADTFFIASGHRGQGEDESFGMDASHRGGDPGFVRVVDGRHLLFPDYAGNNHFNTLGNLVADPRAGLLFVDFERGDLLQLTGRATVLWDAPELESFPGARRLVHFALEQAVRLPAGLPLRFRAAARRPFRILAKTPESEDVTSFLLEPEDGAPVDAFAPGQYLPIELPREGEAPLARTYSLSAPAGAGRYRLSVKRETHGAASRRLHDALGEGDTILARPPQGEFVLEPGERPVVLVGAGVGITPLVPMLHALRSDPKRRATFVQGARDARHHPLAAELRQRVASDPTATLHVAYSRPGPRDVAGLDYDSEGRIDVALLEKLLPGLAADFYLCGPTAFMAELKDGLDAAGVPAERVRSESFGPAS